MKNRKTNFIKLGILLFGISLFLFNCEKEEVNQTIENNSSLKTVSKKETVTFLNNYKVLAKGNSSNLTYDISKINFEDITNSDSKLAVIPAEFKNSKLYTRILLLKINDTIKNVVYNMHPNAKQETPYFSGLVTLTNLKGKIKKAFRYLNGIMTNTYILQQNNYHSRSSSNSTDGCDRSVCGHFDWDPDCICNIQGLDEIEITSSTNNSSYAYISVVDLYGGGESEDTGTCEVSCNGWNGGGGSGDSDNTANTCLGGKVYNAISKKCECPDGKVEDKNGNCVVDPCDKVKKLEANSIFKEKLEELKENTTKDYETGFLLNHNSTAYDPIQGNSGQDYIDFTVTGSFDGFIHSHFLPNGNSIFSPDDIQVLYFLYNNKFINNTNTFIMSVVTGQGTSYTIIINDKAKFKNFGLNNLNNVANFTSFDTGYKANHHQLHNLFGLDNIQAREVAMLEALKDSGLSLLKGNSDFSEWQKIETKNRDIQNVDCE